MTFTKGGEGAVTWTRAAHLQCKGEFAELDLASFVSVRRFAEHLNPERIDALACNAGLCPMAWGETEPGLERTVGVRQAGSAVQRADGGRTERSSHWRSF